MTTEKDNAPVKGAFVSSLQRTSSQIKRDRAEGIAEDAETAFRRAIEDMKTELKRLKRNRKNSLDLSPNDINSLVLGNDFNGEEFVKKDLTAGVAIRNLEVKIQIAEERYEYLFGDASEEEKTTSSEPATVS